MSDRHLPAYTPSYTATKTVRPRLAGGQMPSWGIEQRKTFGRNQIAPEWSVRWITTPAEANTLDVFLEDRAKTGEWFLWTPPNGTQGRYRCDTWSKQLINCAVLEIKATFRRVFSYDLPSMVPELGSLQLAGEAQTRWNRLVGAGVGAYTLGGGEVGLSKTRPMLMDPGAVALAGTDTGLYRGFRLSAEAGGVASAGPWAGLYYMSLSSDYFSNLADQVYGWDRDFQVDWWGD